MTRQHIAIPRTSIIDPLVINWGLRSIRTRGLSPEAIDPRFEEVLKNRDTGMVQFHLRQLQNLGPPHSRDLRDYVECLKRGDTLTQEDIPLIAHRAYLEAHFYRDLKGYFEALEVFQVEDSLPPYYDRFLNAVGLNREPTGRHFRIGGFLPPRYLPIQGVVEYYPGFRQGGSYDYDAIHQLIQSGYAVFTLESLDHGISAPNNPFDLNTVAPHAQTLQVLQFMDEVDRIVKNDPRLHSQNKRFAVCLSTGALYFAAALMEPEVETSRKYAGIILDAPRLASGGLVQSRPLQKRIDNIKELYELLSKSRDLEGVQNKLRGYAIATRDLPWSQDKRIGEKRKVWLDTEWKVCDLAYLPPHLVLSYAYEKEVREKMALRMIPSDLRRRAPLLILLNPQDRMIDAKTVFLLMSQRGDEEITWIKTGYHTSIPDYPPSLDTVIGWMRKGSLPQGAVSTGLPDPLIVFNGAQNILAGLKQSGIILPKERLDLAFIAGAKN